ncbi:MAG TPA: apolipoprotein N-acyltransferase, partial [Sunxiuqinia sp.]|nr:apolipoprotein N-acyltransferase [Sunxiuqinia sp.]
NLLFFKAFKFCYPRFSLAAIPVFFLFIVFLVVPWSISSHRYKHYREHGKSYNIVILQPNVDPYSEKFTKGTQKEQLQTLLQLTDSMVTDSTDYVVGPETALQPLWQNDSLVINRQIVPFIERTKRHPRLNFVLGAMTKKTFQPNSDLPESARKFENRDLYYDVYNSALQINDHREIEIYHKSILVSGVEKMPFSKYFSFIEKYIVNLGGTTGSLGKQKEPSVFTGTSGVKVGPIICFESAFSQYVSKFVKKGAQLLFVITNDGWWKDSAGYKQHFSYARLRAVETRRSIARSANTGLSALINQRGDIIEMAPHGIRAAIKGQLKVNDKMTFYMRYGDYLGRISLFISVMLLLYFFTQSRIRKTSI